MQEAPLAYDAIWAVALALNKTIARLKQRGEAMENFTYTNKRIMGELWKAMNATQFLGVSVSASRFPRNSLSFIDRRFSIGCSSAFEHIHSTFKGYVSFSAKGDRMAQTQIEQMISE